MKTRGALLVLLAVFLAGTALAADLTVEKWSGDESLPVDPFQADGLVKDAENSYAWSMAEFGKYIYAGTNRNYLRQILETFAGGTSGLMDDMFPPAADPKAKIYRKPADGSGDWELFYESPMVDIILDGNPMTVVLDNGYRGMQVFNGALYIATYSFFTSPYSRVLRLADPEGTGADLEEVLRVENTGGSGLRSLAVFQDTLLIGTENLYLGQSAAPVVQSAVTTPINMVTVVIPMGSYPSTTDDLGGKDGWTVVADATCFPGVALAVGWGGIWDFVTYNGFLYMSIADPANGFSLYKSDGTPSGTGDLWVWTPIVADQALNPGAIYPQGLGSTQNTAVSMAEFKGDVYAGTFTSWNDILQGLMQIVSDPSTAASVIAGVIENWTPPQVYRFGTDDKWDMVVGDQGTSSPLFHAAPLSGWRAGFFVHPDPLVKNLSTNRYIWRMQVYKDHLFMGTMDMRPILQVLVENLAGSEYQPAIHSALLHLLEMFEAANPKDPAGFDLFVTSDGTAIDPVTRDGGFGEMFGKTAGGDSGDRHNYGARTFLASNGLFLGTANPFFGCQVWKLDYPSEPEPVSGGGGGGCSSQNAGAAVLLLLVPALAAIIRGRKL